MQANGWRIEGDKSLLQYVGAALVVVVILLGYNWTTLSPENPPDCGTQTERAKSRHAVAKGTIHYLLPKTLTGKVGVGRLLSLTGSPSFFQGTPE